MTNCLFCRIAAREIAATIVMEDETTLTFADIAPAAPFHLLVIPKQHFANVTEAPLEMLDRLLQIAARVGQGKLPAGFRIVLNTGADGGQTVDHLHLHILGGRMMHWPPG